VPKRKIRDSLIPPDIEVAVLAAMKEALSRPHTLTLDEERDFLARRAHGAIERHEYIVTERRGERVYRKPGKAGADLAVPPFHMEMLKRQRDFETECAKVARRLAFKYRHRLQHSRKAEDRAQRIRELAKTITSHGSIKAIARKEGCSVRTVQRALRKCVTSKVTDSSA
jgi:molybdenum-dependent DNA-binding transcriptional regulator ModE